MSKKMGSGYLTETMKKYYRDRQIACIVREGGHIISMPRYYKQKIFTKHELKLINNEYHKLKETDMNEISAKIEHEHLVNIIRRDEKQRKLKRLKI
jgi:hypothetical protein